MSQEQSKLPLACTDSRLVIANSWVQIHFYIEVT
jgi:hypothetical protein